MSEEKSQRAKGKKQDQSMNGVKTSDGKSHPRWNFEKRLFAASIILFALSLVVLAVAGSVTCERTRVPFAGVAINKPVTQGASTMTVTDVKTSSGVKPFVAPTGYEYVVLNLSVRNNSEKPFDILPTTDTYVKTADGLVSYVAPFTLQNPFHSGQLLPGETTRGALSFMVPKKSTYKFYIESGWSGGAVSFMIQSDKHKQDTK